METNADKLKPCHLIDCPHIKIDASGITGECTYGGPRICGVYLQVNTYHPAEREEEREQPASIPPTLNKEAQAIVVGKPTAPPEQGEEKPIEIVFDGPPSHESGRFVEVEQDGKSIKFGEWREGKDGFWYLTLPKHYSGFEVLMDAMSEILRNNGEGSIDIAKNALKDVGVIKS